jgi:hypothetical protein
MPSLSSPKRGKAAPWRRASRTTSVTITVKVPSPPPVSTVP